MHFLEYLTMKGPAVIQPPCLLRRKQEFPQAAGSLFLILDAGHKTRYVSQETMACAQANGIDIEYDTFGKRGDRPILLIMGLSAQVMAIEHPGRMLSLISMESTTGEPDLPPARPEARNAMFSGPPQDREGYIAHMIRVFRSFAGASSAFDEAMEEALCGMAYDRSLYPLGFVRQLAAVMAAGGRRDALRSISVPALVIHGADDPLVPLEHGKDTADAIPHARLLVVEGLGHGFSYPSLWQGIVEAIAGHTTGIAQPAAS